MLKRHKYEPYVKSLLHFDYGYPDSVAEASATTEAAGGLRDEIGLEAWTRSGYVTFVGQEAPAVVVAGTPKFGWRCPQFGGTLDFVRCYNASGIWNLKPAGTYEISFFIRPTDALAGNIFALRDAASDLFLLTKNTSNQLIFQCAAWGDIYETSTAALTTNAFQYIRIRIFGKHLTVYVDGAEFISVDLTTDTRLAVSEVRLGGFPGQVDEFSFLHTAFSEAATIPTDPMPGFFDVNTVGGFGNGTFGDETLSVAGDMQINTYAGVTAMSSSAATLGTIHNGIYGTFVPGNEVMLHLSLKRGADESELGFYAVRRIARIVDNDVVFDTPIVDEFDAATAAGKYSVQMLTIPNYATLLVQLGTTVVPRKWDGVCGGIVALKTQDRCTVNGKIITIGTGPQRTDGIALTHTDIAERFVNTGNVFIACGSVMKAAEEARIGAHHAGDLTGIVGLGGDGEDGIATENPNGSSHPGAPGGVGGAGGTPGFPGKGGTGGQNIEGYSGAGGAGGAGGMDAVGGSPLFNLSVATQSEPGEDGKHASPVVMIITKKLAVPTAVISVGGVGGGGGGSGNDGSGGYVPASGGKGGNAPIPNTVSTKSEDGGTGLNGVTGGVGGNHGGCGYGGHGGKSGGVKPSYSGSSGAGGGGGATGFAYLSYEEMGYDG